MSSKRRKLRKIFSRTMQGEVLEEFISKILRNEPLCPEKTAAANESLKNTKFMEGFWDESNKYDGYWPGKKK